MNSFPKSLERFDALLSKFSVEDLTLMAEKFPNEAFDGPSVEDYLTSHNAGISIKIPPGISSYESFTSPPIKKYCPTKKAAPELLGVSFF